MDTDLEVIVRVERFEDSSMDKVLAQIRAEMGSSAVLVSSRNQDGRTEVIAAQDYDPEKLEEALADLDRRKKEKEDYPPSLDLLWEVVDDEKVQASNSALMSAKSAAQPQQDDSGIHTSFESMLDEISRLRELFEGELAYTSRQQQSAVQPHEAELMERLQAASLGEDLCRKIVTKVLPCSSLESGWRRVQRLLCR